MKPPPSLASSSLGPLATPLVAIVLGVVLVFVLVVAVAVAIIKFRTDNSNRCQTTTVRIRSASASIQGEYARGLCCIGRKPLANHGLHSHLKSNADIV